MAKRYSFRHNGMEFSHVEIAGNQEEEARKLEALKVKAKTWAPKDLYTPEFMAKHTQFPTLDAYLEACGLSAKEDRKGMPSALLNAHVARYTQFSTVEEMRDAAIAEAARRFLGEC